MVPLPGRPGPVAGQTPPGSTFPVQLPRRGLRPAPPGGLTGPGPTRPRVRPRWAGPVRATPIPGSGAGSSGRSSPPLGRAVAERDAGAGRRRAPRGHLESTLLRRLAGVTAAFTGLLRTRLVRAVARSRCGLWCAL